MDVGLNRCGDSFRPLHKGQVSHQSGLSRPEEVLRRVTHAVDAVVAAEVGPYTVLQALVVPRGKCRAATQPGSEQANSPLHVHLHAVHPTLCKLPDICSDDSHGNLC